MEQPSIEEVRVPSSGGTILSESGPVITSSEPGLLSEFLLKQGGDMHMFRYGWPEIIEGELAVPKDQSQAKAEGYITWWRNQIGSGGTEDTQQTAERLFKENTVSLLGE